MANESKIVLARDALRSARTYLIEARLRLLSLAKAEPVDAPLKDLEVAIEVLDRALHADANVMQAEMAHLLAMLKRTLDLTESEADQRFSRRAAAVGIGRALAIVYVGYQALEPPPRERGEEILKQSVPPRKSAQSIPPLPLTSIPPTARDRRIAPRVMIAADIGFVSENNFYIGYAEDLSDGGIFVTTYDMLPMGTPVSITFALPTGYQIAAFGRVAWLRQPNMSNPDLTPGMGIAFEGLPPSDVKAVRAFLKSREPMFYTDE